MPHIEGYSPGPYEACHNGECQWGMIFTKDHPIAEVFSGEWGDEHAALRITGPSLDQKVEAYIKMTPYGEIDPKVAVANRQLLAASWRMHQALMKMENIIETGDYAEAMDAAIESISDLKAWIRYGLTGERPEGK